MKATPRHRRAGYSLLEVLVAAALFALVLAKASLVISQTGEAVEDGSAEIALESQARSVLDRICLAVMSSDRENLVPVLTPGHSTQLRFQVSLGVQNGEVIWAETEEIGLGGEANEQVVWRESPDMPTERRVVWTNLVRPFLEGEVPNGVDDNGNGLIDEEGLSFFVDGNAVRIRLSLGRTGPDGQPVVRTLETLATCRNNPLD